MTHFTPRLVSEGRLIELEAMNALYVGNPMRGSEATELAKSLGIRIIPCRWVLTAKTVNGIAGQCRAAVSLKKLPVEELLRKAWNIKHHSKC